jgi:hypothetical protein
MLCNPFADIAVKNNAIFTKLIPSGGNNCLKISLNNKSAAK